MKLEQAFEVTAPLERVWDALIDVERVAPCLPGASVTGRNDDGSYNGAFSVKIGPTTASYTGKLEMENVDEGAHTAVMQANGTDKRGQGGAKATITSVLKPLDGGGTRVEVVTDYHITGRLARFGRGGMIEDISEKLLKQFAAALQESLGAKEAIPPAAETPTPATAAQTGTMPEAARSSVQPGDGDGGSAPSGAPPPESAPPESAPPESAPPTESSPFPGATPPPPAGSEAIQAHSLLASVMWDRFRRNPAPLVGGVLAILLLWHFSRRRARRRERSANSESGA